MRIKQSSVLLPHHNNCPVLTVLVLTVLTAVLTAVLAALIFPSSLLLVRVSTPYKISLLFL